MTIRKGAERRNIEHDFPNLPTPVKLDSRICFGIAYFETEAAADYYDRYVRAAGLTYNGGMLHGARCGRAKCWDHADQEGRQLFAVTH